MVPSSAVLGAPEVLKLEGTIAERTKLAQPLLTGILPSDSTQTHTHTHAHAHTHTYTHIHPSTWQWNGNSSPCLHLKVPIANIYAFSPFSSRWLRHPCPWKIHCSGVPQKMNLTSNPVNSKMDSVFNSQTLQLLISRETSAVFIKPSRSLIAVVEDEKKK